MKLSVLLNAGLPLEVREKLHRKLLAGQQLISPEIFVDAKQYAEKILEDAWICYLKEDYKSYLELVEWHTRLS
jgi:hypothetical protein